MTVPVKTVSSNGKPVIGVDVEQQYIPFSVRISVGDIGGPSAA